MPTCKCSDLGGFLGDSSATSTEFYNHDLDELMDQPGAASLKLKTANCSLSLSEHSSGSEESHTVAIALDNHGVELLSRGKAALPCPPHCGGKKFTGYPKTTIAGY